MNLFQPPSFRPLTVAIAATFSMVLAVSTVHASGNVQWGVSVEMPVQVSVPVPVPAVYPVYTPPPVAVQVPPPPPLPVAPKLPNIEHMQAKQQARIQWGAQVGLIEPHEYRRLQHTQQSIEQQRQWAYADGWLTYDEHLNLVNLLNGAVSGIERVLAHGQKRLNSEYYAYATNNMPAVLTVWNMPPPAVFIYDDREHEHHHGRGHHKDDRDDHRKERLVAPPPPSPIAVQPVTSMPVIKTTTGVQAPSPVPAIFINGRGGQRFEPTRVDSR